MRKIRPLAQSHLGATVLKNGSVSFLVWAPHCRTLDVEIQREKPLVIPMKKDSVGYFCALVPKAREGDRYFYVLDGERKRPDPASRYQPQGVHGPSQVVRTEQFRWTDKRWKGLKPESYIFYEMHVGTFTPEGTFVAAIKRLKYLKKLGITCVEIMPIAQFPGERNWGYDGVGIFAAQNSYGGPAGLKRFVEAAHNLGLAVCLDVVYNHFGPEGNYWQEYGPYLTGRYRTPWGEAVNYDDVDSLQVRRFVIENTCYWIRDLHIDALRIDAIHSIYDSSACHILSEIKNEVDRLAQHLKRRVLIVAESDLNDSKVIRSKHSGGYNIDAQWSDDFHHAVHALLTGERNGYYQDYHGVTDLAKVFQEPFIYDGRYSVFRRRHHGNSSKGIPGHRFVVAIQNHDQIGNRACGERLGQLVSFETLKVAAALLLVSPYIPLLFMGEEFGDTSPFQYFVDHLDPVLIEAVRRGRKNEFKAFKWNNSVPDPKACETFEASRPNWQRVDQKPHALLFKLYQDLIRFRKRPEFLKVLKTTKRRVRMHESAKWLAVEYPLAGKRRLALMFSLSHESQPVAWPFQKRGKLQVLFNTAWRKYGGVEATVKQMPLAKLSLRPHSVLVGYARS